MATGLRKLIRNARKMTSSALLARRLRRPTAFNQRLRIEELEERIAPAVGDFDGTGTPGATTMTLTDGQWASLELGTDLYTLTAGGGYTTGDIVITFDGASGSATKITSIDFGNSDALDADATLILTSSEATVNDTLAIDSIIDGNDNSGTVSLSGSDPIISDAMAVGTVTLDQSGITTWDTNGVTGLTAETVETSMRVGTVGAGGITATTSFAGTLTVTGSLDGPVTSAAGIGNITLEAGSTDSGDITATTGDIGTVTLGNAGDDDVLDFIGDIISTAGAVGTISGTDENSITITGDVTAATTVGDIGTHLQTIAGTVTGGTSVGTVTVLTDLSGAIVATADVGAVTVGNDLSGAITAGTTIGDITVTDGSLTSTSVILAGTGIGNVAVDTDASGTDESLAGAITATTGDIGTVTVGADTPHGDLTGTITATAGAVGAVTVGNDLSGTITAGTTIGDITVVDGSLTSTSTILAGTDVGNVAIDVDEDGEDESLAGSIIATTGSIGTVDVGGGVNAEGDLTGSLSAGTTIGDVTLGNDLSLDATISATASVGNIVVDNDIAGSIIAGTVANVTSTDGGLTGSITSTTGSIGDVTIDSNATSETGMTADGSINSADKLGAVTVGEDLAGTITTAGNAMGTISAQDITGAISIGGNLHADVTATDATDGSIDSLTVTGAVNTFYDQVDITAAGGSVTLTAGGLVTVGHDLNVTATDDLTVTINGQSDGKIDGAAGTIALTADSGDADDTDDGANGGDLTVSATHTISGDVLLSGDAISVTMNTHIEAADDDYNSLTSINADRLITIAPVTGSLTITTVDSHGVTAGTDVGGVGDITSTGSLNITTMTAGMGDIGNVSATSTANSDADATAGTWTATAGNIGTVSADHNITITTTIEATVGTVGTVTAGNTLTGGTIVAGAQTADANGLVLRVVDEGINYDITTDLATADGGFSLTFDASGAENEVDIDVTKTVPTAMNLSLKTSNNADDTVNDSYYNLTGLDFDAATITAGNNDFNVVTIDGDSLAAINLGAASTVNAFIAQGNIAGTITVDSINLLAASEISGGGDATVAEADTITDSVAMINDPTAVATDGSFGLPIDDSLGLQVFGNNGTTSFFVKQDLVHIGLGTTADAEATVTFTAGVITSVTGADVDLTINTDVTTPQDFTDFAHAVTINGDVNAAVTLAAEIDALNINGDVGAGGSVTGGDVNGDVDITGNVNGPVTLGELDGELNLGGDVNAAVTTGDINDNVDIDGNLAANVTIGDVDGSVDVGTASDEDTIAAGVQLAIGSTADSVEIAGNMFGALVTGDLNGNDINIGGDFASVILVNGNAGMIDLSGTGGSATSLIGVTGELDGIDLTGTDENLLVNLFTGGDGGATVIDLDADTTYQGGFALGQTGGFSAFEISIDGTNMNVIDFGSGGSAAGTASNTGQNVVLDGGVILDGNASLTIGDSGNAFEVDVTDIYIGDTHTSDITVEGNITGMVSVDDDADVAAATDAAAIFNGLAAILTDPTDVAAAAAFAALLPGSATNPLGDSFGDDAGGVEADNMDIDAFSLAGGLFIEGTNNGTSSGNSITTSAGDSGPVDVNRGNLTNFDLNIDGNQGDINVPGGSLNNSATWSINGNLGDLNAESIDVDMDVNGDAGTFTATDLDIDGDMVIAGSMFGGLRAFDSSGEFNDVVLDVDPDATIHILISGDLVDDFLANSSFDTDQVEILLLDVFDGLGGGSNRVLVDNDSIEIASGGGIKSVTTAGGPDFYVLVDDGGTDNFDNITALTGVDAGESIVVVGDVDLFDSHGALAGSFEADVDVDSIEIDGDWSGSITVNSKIEFSGDGEIIENDSEIGKIGVIGNITATAALNVDSFDEIKASGTNNSEQSVTINGGESHIIASNFAGVAQTIWLQASSSVSAQITTVFNKVSEIALSGRGNASIVSVNASLDADNSTDLKTLKEIQNDTRKGDDNDVLLNGSEADVGSIVLATPNTQGKLNIDDTVIDGDLDRMQVGFKSSVRRVTVTGDAGDLTLGRTVDKLYVEGQLGTLNAKSAKNVWIGGDVDEFAVIKASRIDIEGDVNFFGVTNAKNVNIFGDVASSFSFHKANNVNVWGDTNLLAMSGKGASINKSFFHDVSAFNDHFDFDKVHSSTLGED